jgi:hypothetical protein
MWRYDTDPIHRISKNLKQNARDRRVRLDRRILASKQEAESLGEMEATRRSRPAVEQRSQAYHP